MGELSRRGLLRGGGAAGVLALTGTAAASAEPAATGPYTYQALGVRPVINAKGTYSVLGGSLMSPEVCQAMNNATQAFVDLDELSDAIGTRLAKLLGAPHVMVTSSCSAALTHATSVCLAGGNVDLHAQLPDLTGLPSTEVIIPQHSRNPYETSVTSFGLKVVEVATVAELTQRLGSKTALIYFLAGPSADESELNLKAVTAAAKRHDVPVLVDAAAEILTVPNKHLSAGATLVAYSGGKVLRGPQSSGMLLGPKDLLTAALRVHAAPRHGVGRGYKVGKEEMLGLLAAVETWMKRDHAADQRQWTAWLQYIADRLRGISGVQTVLQRPSALSDHTPILRVLWDKKKFETDGEAVTKALFAGAPRIAVEPDEWSSSPQTGVMVAAYMLQSGQEKVVADRLAAILLDPPRKPTEPATVDITGTWNVQIDFAASRSTAQVLELTQRGRNIEGVHRGEFAVREIHGRVDKDKVFMDSWFEGNGDELYYAFSGTAAGKTMSGTLDMGEYGTAAWKATRR
ncbi:aminotransferase class V-fold PLP-dependent enzyme [Amycolatopsis sp. cg5]|uniref:aminotransferase class V-fold PLP-dependent enzyme n=1 Tax=Amycolatopsis sp. cg5 TaxID=3238802 RepID=UPI0035264C70